jgi:hypothetical protein
VSRRRPGVVTPAAGRVVEHVGQVELGAAPTTYPACDVGAAGLDDRAVDVPRRRCQRMAAPRRCHRARAPAPLLWPRTSEVVCRDLRLVRLLAACDHSPHPALSAFGSPMPATREAPTKTRATSRTPSSATVKSRWVENSITWSLIGSLVLVVEAGEPRRQPLDRVSRVPGGGRRRPAAARPPTPRLTSLLAATRLGQLLDSAIGEVHDVRLLGAAGRAGEAPHSDRLRPPVSDRRRAR